MMIDNSYINTTINDPFAVYRTYGNAINADGQVAGQYADSNGVSHAVLYKNGKYTVLNDPLATATAAVGNNNCQIVGQQYTDSSVVAQSFLYSKVAYDSVGALRTEGIVDRGEVAVVVEEAVVDAAAVSVIPDDLAVVVTADHRWRDFELSKAAQAGQRRDNRRHVADLIFGQVTGFRARSG